MIKTATDSDAHTKNTHDGHVVQRHPDVLAVIQSRDLNMSGLPGQESPKQLKINILYKGEGKCLKV